MDRLSTPLPSGLAKQLSSGRAADRIELLAIEIIRISRGKLRLFLYDPQLSGFVELFGANSPKQPPGKESGPLPRERLGRMSSAHAEDSPYFDRLHFVHRGRTPIAALYCEERIPNIADLIQLANLFPFLYDLRTAERLLFNLNVPVDFSNSEIFFERLSHLVSKSSGMDSGAFRTLTPERELKCLFTWKQGEVVERELYSNWSCTLSDYPFFERCISKGETVSCRNLPNEYPDFARRPEQRGIISFCAVPVQVGQRTEGVLTVAQRHEYEFSQIEEEGFKSIANSVGVAISNYRNFHQARHEAHLREKELSAAQTVEVAQSIRHEIISSADMIISNTDLLEMSRDDDRRFGDILGVIKGEADVINKSVKKMKQAMDFERNVEFTTIEHIIWESFNTLEHRLSHESIDYNRGKNYGRTKDLAKKYLIIPNLIRFCVHNLILNSIESLSAGKKRNREIMVEIEKDDPHQQVVLRYFDNGQGLDIGSLAVKMQEFVATGSQASGILQGQYGERRKKEMVYDGIFQERITTKAAGSGYGLYLARKMIAHHCGNIACFEPHDPKWSIGFRVDFSTSLERLLDRNKRVILRADKSERKDAEKQIMEAMLKLGPDIEVIYPTDL